jgi:endonuclease/exonuclease/phosphatase family metal-dependent hydrolase
MKKRKLSFFDKVMLLIAIVAAVGLICGTLASSNDPNAHIFLAFAGLAYPFVLLVNAILLLWWLLRQRWVFALVTLAVIAIGWHTLNATIGLFGNAGRAEKEDAGLVRMMTYNVHSFKPYGEELTRDSKAKIFEVVRSQNPDIICFQEFYTKFKGPYDTIDSLKKMLNTDYYYFEPKAKSLTEAMGFAIFSKYPIKNKGNIIFENSGGNGSIFVDLTVKNQTVRVYNIHLQSISFEKEDYSYIDKVKDMETKVGPSKRILHMLKSAFEKRSIQVVQLKNHMATCATPMIIAGDFNDTPASYAVTKMTDSLNNAFIKKGQGLGRTYNGKFPNFQIDYIATSKDIEVMNYQIIEAKLSDHFPVRSDLRLKP